MKTPLIIILVITLTTAFCFGADDTAKLPPGDSPPPTAFDRLNKAGDAADFDSAAYVVVFDSTENKINDLGITYTDNYMLYKVLTEAGCKELSVLTWRYEPLSSITMVEGIDILRGDSTIALDIDKLLDLPAPRAAWEADGARDTYGLARDQVQELDRPVPALDPARADRLAEIVSGFHV